MRVLLTGAEGFIGSAVRRALVGAGHEVVAVDLMIAQAHGSAAKTPKGVHRLDVRTAAQDPAWTRLLCGIDVVCHQAALVGVESMPADLPGYAAHNDLGTAALLAGMAAHRVPRLVLASSMVVYGEGSYSCVRHGPQEAGERTEALLAGGDFEHHCTHCGERLEWLPTVESAPLRPRSAYAASKVAQEHYAAAWARHTGGRVVALRYHNVYGPGMPRDSSYCGVAAVFRSRIDLGLAPLVLEDGAQTRDFVHVSDVARANLMAVTAEGPSAAYNIASGHPVTIGEMAAALTTGTDVDADVTGGYRPGDVRHVVASPAAAARELGFTASVLPADGLRELATASLREVVA